MKKTFALLLMLVLALGISVQATELPAEYTAVDYVFSGGRGYIDTEVVPADAESSMKYEIDFAYDVDDFTSNNLVMLGVGRDSKRAGNIIAGMNDTTFKKQTTICVGSQAPATAAIRYDNTTARTKLVTEFDFDAGTYTVTKDGVAYDTETIVGDPKSEYSYYLLANHGSNGAAGLSGIGKVYSLKMWQDGTLVRDFVPCARIADDEAGFYDLVAGKFYTCPTSKALKYPGQAGNMIEGDTAIVMNANTGEIYYGQSLGLEHGMASTTKTMTCILTIENMALTDRTLVANEFDLDTSGSMMYLEEGEELLIYDALRGLMLPSGNDAARLLARTVGTKLGGNYDTFIEMMNQKAVELGMMNTHYNSPVGGEYTTVEDYAKLGHYCMQNPIFRDVVATVDYTIEADPTHGVVEHVLRNTNYLLPGTFVGNLPSGDSFGDVYYYEGITGIKTGTTSSAGACLLSTATREVNGEQVDLVSVILGTNGNDSPLNRFTETIKMYDYGFELAETQGYEVTVDGNKLTAKNPVTGYTMTAVINAPDVALTGASVEPAVVTTTNSDGRDWDPYWDITYTDNVAVGTATASITFGGKTASCEFEIVEPTVVLMEDTEVDTLVVPAGQTVALTGGALIVHDGLVVNEGGQIAGGTLVVCDTATVNLGSNGGWVPIYLGEVDLHSGEKASLYMLCPAEIKAGKNVVSTETGTTYAFGYKLWDHGIGWNPYYEAVAANAMDKIKFGVQLDLGETKIVYKFSGESIAKMEGIDATATSDEFFKVNLNLAGTNNPLTKVRVAPVIKVDELGFAYVGEATGETDGEYVARIGNNTWYYTLEDAIAAAEAAGEVTDIKLIHDIEFKRPVTIKMNGKVRFKTAADAEVTLSGPVTFDGQGIDADCALFYFNGSEGEITLDGVTVRNYNNTGADSVNDYGSAIVATASTVTLKDVTIEDCTAKSRGAAIYAYNDASIVAENCTFENLKGNASYGGAISIVNAVTADFDGCEFINCAATTYGGAIAARTGTSTDLGICDVAMTLDNCTFTDCTASSDGGAIAFGGEGSLSVNGGSFSGCTANGAANDLYVEKVAAKLDGATDIGTVKLDAGAALEPLANFSVTDPVVIDGAAGNTVLVGSRVAELNDTAFKGTDETRTIDDSGILNVSGAAVATVDGTPYTSLAAAVDAAKALGTEIDVYLVGAESFTEDTVIELGDNVRLFVGADAAATLNGNGKLTIKGSDTATRHLCQFNGGGSLTLNGVTVKTHTTGTGNGVFDVNKGTFVLNDCVLEDLTAARGAVYLRNSGANLTATDTVFKNNTSTTFGGAISAWSKCDIELYGCTFEGNAAEGSFGGAIGIYAVPTGSLTIKSSATNDTVFKNNTAATFGGAVAIYHDTADTYCAIETEIQNVTFEQNTASAAYGGAIAWRRASGSVMDVTNCDFIENKAGTYGGAISAYNGNGGGVTLNITDCEVKDNSAGTHSGMIYFYGKALNIKDTVITGNTAATAGEGAIRATNSAKVTFEGVTMNDNSTYDIFNYNCTITLKGKNNIETVWLREGDNSAYKSVTLDSTFTTDAPIALIPQNGAGHVAILGSNIEANLANFFVAKADGTVDTTLTIDSTGTVVAAE